MIIEIWEHDNFKPLKNRNRKCYKLLNYHHKMFTGLIYKFGVITSYEVNNSILKLTVACDSSVEYFEDANIGDSVCTNGCCLTIVKKEIIGDNVIMTFDVMSESLSKSNFSGFKTGNKVHLEKAMNEKDRYNGHMINGHVMGIVYLIKSDKQSDGSLKLTFSLPDADKIIVYKDCVALDGVSLTISDVTSDSFSVSLIPHTQENTLLVKTVGSSYNVEFVNINTLNFRSSTISVDHMKSALDLSKKGKNTTYPNPWVGAIIINEKGEIISEGYHKEKGDIHAERDALEKVKNMDLKNCVLYCTLEPCSQQFPGKNQPLCSDLIIKSGIKQVVIGILDPDDHMKGKAVDILEKAGIKVTVVNDDRISKSLRPYIINRKFGRPYIVLKSAISLDGKIALSNGTSQWISGEESRIDTHKLRQKCQAVLVGTNTALKDHPTLNVRLPDNEIQPLRCFIDLKGRVVDGPLMNITLGKVIVFTSENVDPKSKKLWDEKGLTVVYIKNLNDILSCLKEAGVLRLLVEGGAKLLTSFINENLADELILYQAPVLIGKDGINFYDKIGLTNIDHDILKLRKTKRLGDDIKSYYNICINK